MRASTHPKFLLFPLLGSFALTFLSPLSPLSPAAFAAEDPTSDPFIVVEGKMVPLSLIRALQEPTLDQEARTQALAERASYEQAIATMEVRQGVYGADLSEAYMGLGTTLRKLELHEEAAGAFGKALQSLRISFGLNELRQLPVLQELRTTNETLRNWDEVHTANHLIYHIAKHNADATQDLRIASLLQLGHWIRKADIENLVSDFNANSADLLNLYDNEAELLEASAPYDGKGAHLAMLYLDLAAVELMEAKRKYEMPISEFQTPGAGEQRTVVTQQCFAVQDRSGRAVTVCNQPVELPNINYYLAPNSVKNSEIRGHLAEVENKVLLAFNTLQDEPAPDEQQTALMSEVRRLTQEYNEFIKKNQ